MQAHLPKQLQHLLTILDTIKNNTTAVLLLRHAEREPIVSGDDGVKADLTPTGYKQSYHLGQLLKDRLTWAHYSPLLRAERTVEQIINGANLTTIIKRENNCLGCPGPFVVNRKKGAELFTKLGTENLVKNLAAGMVFDGIRSAKEGAEFFITHLKQLLPKQIGLGLMISHDAIIIPLLAILAKEDFQDKWLEALDGALLVINDQNQLLLHRNYEVFQIN